MGVVYTPVGGVQTVVNKQTIAELVELANQINEVVNDLESGKFQKKVANEAATAIYEDINKIFDTAVDEYYSYKPKYYKRTGSLYQAYKITKEGTYIGWDVGAHLIEYSHRVSNEYIFDYMFELGYHGGASKGKPDQHGNPFPHFMAFRTPVPGFAAQYELKPYSLWSKSPARKSSSPSMSIGSNIRKYENGVYNTSGNTLKSQIEYAWEYVKMDYSLFARFS